MRRNSENFIKHFSYKNLLLALVEWNEEVYGEIEHDKWWEKHPFSYNDLIRIANLKLKRKPNESRN